MKFKAELTVSDMLKFSIWQLSFSTLYRKINFVFMVVVGLVILVAYIIHPISIIMLFFPLFMFILLPLTTYFTIKKNFIDNRDLYSVEYEIDDQNIIGRSANYKFEESWTIYKRVVETKGYFALQITKRQYRLVPKRAMTGEQVKMFRQYAKLV